MPTDKRSSDKRERKKEAARYRAEARRAAQRRATIMRVAITAVALVIVIAAVAIIASRGKKETPKPAALKPVKAGATITGDTPCPKPDGSSPRTTKFEKAPPMCIDPAKTYHALFVTTEGTIDVALDAKDTPGTVNNFVVLSRYHYYDGSAIHRTAPDIDIIQGGAPTTQSASDPGPGYTIKDEGSPPRHYKAGDLVMARTQGKDSAGSQYFFVAGDKASALDTQGTYVTFGAVAKGEDIVEKIIKLHVPYPPSDPKSQLGGAPRKPVIIKQLKITES